jgi:transposase
MSSSPFLPLPPGVEILTTTTVDDLLRVEVVSTRSSSCCPLCFHRAMRIHSRYTRVVADVPCGGLQVQLVLHVRKFFCDTPQCPRKIFTERLSAFVHPWARMTTRLTQMLQALGLATCGELGTRLAGRLGMHTSPTTLLRRVMALPTAPPGPVSILGIDDWSFRRGRKFGTILVDLRAHQVIELLADRKTETAAAWMQTHDEIDLVSRDRGEDYAAAARLGAPQAKQVADRFHLTKNLVEVVEVVLARCRAEIRRASQPEQAQATPLPEEEPPLPSALDWRPVHPRSQEHARLAHYAQRYDRYQQMLALCKEGLTSKEIARRLGMKDRTVRHWLQQGVPAESKRRRKRSSRFDPYAAYVLQRWQAGQRNGLRICEEIQAQGYQGSSRTIYRFLAALKSRRPDPGEVPEWPLQDFTAREAVWLFVRNPDALDDTEQAELAAIRQASETAEAMYQLVQDFMRMVRHRQGERLDAWLKKVASSQIPEFRRLVRSINRDKAAVVAGLTLPYSNGQVEGQITKLKLIKRTMYGRAGFPLLRQRVLHAL